MQHVHSAAFGQATITIPGSNLSIPLAGGSLGNLTAQNAANTAGQQIIQSQQQQQQQQQSQQNQSTNQTNANAQNQQTHQSVNLPKNKTNDSFCTEVLSVHCILEKNLLKFFSSNGKE